MTIPKLTNPPPRPDRELQKPMVIEFRNGGGLDLKALALMSIAFVIVLAFGIVMEVLKAWIFWRMR